ncbi:MAG: biotin transporter BioY [Candidatus Eisenbacteria bacterium]|uniref:Biotin transporter n=1 Tax=Eiseniibacteriota bacterium TaxID=2212470 RepID=A0A538TEA6_UNCEI|nr:MAG: biotin transporter BioY [Candidatus Eisenbacteria bacterium]
MSGSVRTLTLADAAHARAGWLDDLLLATAASIVTALAARIEIPLPWTPVPITGQTFAVLLSGAVLGARRGFLSQVLYLAEGTFGLPVFAGGAAGFAIFAGPTAGYLVAFPFAAALVGALAERGWDRRFFSMLAAMLLGSAVIFGLGLFWLARFSPVSHLLALGLLPFVPGDLIKATLAALAFPAAWRRLNRRSGIGR